MDGTACQFPMYYNGKGYDNCIAIDNGGIPWCYTTFGHNNWGSCNISTCTDYIGNNNNNYYYYYY